MENNELAVAVKADENKLSEEKLTGFMVVTSVTTAFFAVMAVFGGYKSYAPTIFCACLLSLLAASACFLLAVRRVELKLSSAFSIIWLCVSLAFSYLLYKYYAA